jgi:hypothetical protein
MPQVKASSTFGNYKWFANAEITNEQAQVLQDLGFLWVMQRSPSSKAEKSMAGYEKRPDNFKRSMIEFSNEGVKQLSRLLGAPVEIDEDVPNITPVISKVEFHEIGKGAEPVYADEKKVVAKHRDGKTLVKLAEKVGYTGDGELDESNVEFLKSIKAFKLQLLAKSL